MKMQLRKGQKIGSLDYGRVGFISFISLIGHWWQDFLRGLWLILQIDRNNPLELDWMREYKAVQGMEGPAGTCPIFNKNNLILFNS